MNESAEKEPTMEEILSSIRRIISEEDDEPAPAKARAPEPDAFDDSDADVLDLTDAVEPEPARAPVAAVHAVPLDDDDILVLDRDDEIDPAPASRPVRAPAPEQRMADIAQAQDAPAPTLSRVGEREAEHAAPSGTSVDWDHKEGAMSDRLVSDTAASAAAGAFARLQRTTRVPESSDDKSLEAIVRELLKPMLKDWLDQNLPAIVEKKVREEVERIARQS